MGALRIEGGRGGYKDYLENGRQSGREFHRNDLDNRMWLHGDLQLFDKTVDAMQNKGEKYLRGVFSFEEDNVSPEKLQETWERIKQFLSAGVSESEMMLYAEVHIPKIKSYRDKNGDIQQRKPHIHFGVVKKNLLSGQTMDPLRMVRMQVPYLDALQEKINAELGFSSPKHKPRPFRDASDIIGRLGGKMFKKVGREFKQEFLTRMIDGKVESWEAFGDMLREYGAVRIRNEGRHTEYYHVKPERDADGTQRNGTNFQDPWFRRDFIELPTEEKIARLKADTTDLQKQYIEERAALATPAVYDKELADWFSRKARELVRINSGNRKIWTTYQHASREEQIAMLDRLDAEFFAEHGEPLSQQDQEHERRNGIDGPRNESGPFFVPTEEPYAGPPGQYSRHRLHTLSERNLAYASGRGSALSVLQGDARRDGQEPAIVRREHSASRERGLADSDLSPEEAAKEAKRLEELRETGEQLIGEPEKAIAEVTKNQSVFSRRDIERFLKDRTVDQLQYDRALAAVLTSPELIGLGGEDPRSGRDSRITGKFLARGAAPYDHQKGGKPSYFVRYQTDDGEIREVWGIRLREAMDRLNPAEGDRIALTRQAKTAVTVHEEVRDDNGKVRIDEKTAYRNTWLAEAAPIEMAGNVFTSRNVWNIEQRLIEATERMALNNLRNLRDETRRQAAKTRAFNPGQATAYESLTSSAQIATVNGAAGTGKSYILTAMREAFEAEGYTLHGAILQGKTADDLQRDSGIKSRTIHSMLSALRKGQLTFGPKDVIVVDEAGMVGSRQMEELFSFVEKAGARIRLVGDAKQLHAVEFGNAFENVTARVKPAALTEIMRQKDGGAWMCQASEKLAVHNIAAAVEDYSQHGMVHQHKTHDAAKQALVDAWNADRLTSPDKSQIVLTGTNRERSEMNAIMRTKMQESGDLGAETAIKTESGSIKIAEGERIIFLKNEYQELDVRNGSMGTVEKIDGQNLSVRLQDGRLVTVNPERYGYIDYGYALTVHKSQGMTVHRAYSLASPGMRAENAYVAWTRHKEQLGVYFSEDKFKSLDVLKKRLSTPEKKEFSAAYELIDRAETRAALMRMCGLDEYGNIVRPVDPVVQPSDGIGSALRDVLQRDTIEQANTLPSWTQISKTLEADRLLSHLASTHGLVRSKYEIVKSNDGRDLIVAGSKRYSVNDFLTQEMGFAFKDEAAPILLATYADQMADRQHELKEAPQRQLWSSFEAYRAGEWGERCAALQELQKDSERERFREVADQYREERSNLGSLLRERKYGEYRAMLSIAQTGRVLDEQRLRVTIDAERRELDEKIHAPVGVQFRNWLIEQAEHGNERAIVELRRQAPREYDRAIHSFAPAQTMDYEAQSAPVVGGIEHRVDGDGSVIYTRDGRDVLHDKQATVAVLQHDDRASIETALRLAYQRFGPRLNVNGDASFREQVAQVVADRQLNVTFTDETLNAMVTQLKTAAPAAPEFSLAGLSSEMPEAIKTTLREQTQHAHEAAEQANRARADEELRRKNDHTRNDDNDFEMQ